MTLSKKNATHVLVMLYKTLNINQLEDFQKQVVLYVMDNVNSNPHQWKNVLSVINLLFYPVIQGSQNFMSKTFLKNENGGLNTEKNHAICQTFTIIIVSMPKRK